MLSPQRMLFGCSLAALTAGLLAAGCSGSGTAPPAGGGATGGAQPAAGLKRIVLITNGDSPFWNACGAGVAEANKELKLEEQGYTAVMDVNDGTLMRQLEQLRQYASQADVVAIGISVIDASNVSMAEELRALQKKGVAVITFDSDVDREKYRDARTAFIGTDNRQGGVELGRCASQLLPDGGAYVTFVGLTGAQNALERINGFGEGAGDKFTAQDSAGDEFDKGKAKENVRNAIRNHADLNCLVGIYSYNAPAIAEVVAELKARDKFKVCCFDAEKGALAEMEKGNIDVLVVQNPYMMGFQGVRLLKALVEKDEAVTKDLLPKFGQEGGDIYDTGLKIVVPDEGSPITPDGIGPRTEFIKLKDFRDWLTKYKLTDS